MKDYFLLHEIMDQTVKNNASLSRLPEVWILHHSPLEVFIPVGKHDIVSELKHGVCSFISTITHHLRMELAGTYISEGFGVIWDWDSAKEEVKLYKLSSIFCVNCGMKQTFITTDEQLKHVQRQSQSQWHYRRLQPLVSIWTLKSCLKVVKATWSHHICSADGKT